MLVHTASAAPAPHSGHTALHTPHAVGVTNLCSSKHSFQRAQHRALDTGSAVYRGRCVSAKQLGVEWKSAKLARPRAPTKADSHRRIRVITWNSGGFNLARQAEVRTCLSAESRTSPIHVLCIRGVLIMLNTHFFSSTDIKRAEICPGRMLHVRICSNPAIDLLCVCQHAWNPAKSVFQHRSVPAEQLLINKRQEVWHKMQGWIAGVPKRNLLGILGDFNSSLYLQHPHVGSGVGHSHLHKKDGHALQSLIQTAGLNAVNRWREPGQKASTFSTHTGEGPKIDFILVRNPCTLSHIWSTTLPQAPIVHPTGFRHIPVQCFLEWPKAPQTKSSQSTTAFQVARVCTRFPQVLDQFRSKLQQLSCTAEQLDSQLQEVWEQCRPATAILPITSSHSGSICLKNFWSAKRRLQSLNGSPVDGYMILSPKHSDRVSQLPATARKYLQHLLKCWQATARFQCLNSALRKRSQQARSDKLEGQIQEALNADQKGLTHLYKCMNMMRPKHPKRAVHIKSSEGQLQSNASELTTITDYFGRVFEQSLQSCHSGTSNLLWTSPRQSSVKQLIASQVRKPSPNFKPQLRYGRPEQRLS